MPIGSSEGGGSLAKGIKAGQAYVEITADDGQLSTVLGNIRKKVLGFGKGLAAAGGGLLAAGGGILGPIFGSFHAAVEHFDAIKKASDRLGSSAEAVSALGYAAEQSGSNLEELEGAARKMQKALIDTPEEFNRLGLSADDLRKKGLEEQFADIAEAISGIDDPAERAAAAMAIFGKTGTSMLPLMKDGAKGVRELVEEAKKVGSVVSSEDAANAEKAGDAIDRSWKAVKNTFLAVGAALLPQVETIEQLSAVVVEVTGNVRDFLKENRAAVLAIVGVGAALAVAGSVLVGVGSALAVAATAAGGLAAALTAVGFVIGVVTSTPVVIGAALATAAVMAAALVADFGDLEEISKTLSAVWDGIGSVFGMTWKGIRDALRGGDLKLALQVAVAGLDVIWKGFLAGLQAGWSQFKNVFLEGWYDLMTEVKVATARALKEIGLSDKSTGILAAVSQGLFGKAIGGTAFAGAGMSEEEIRAADAKAKADRKAARAADDKAAADKAGAAQAELLAKSQEAATAAGIAWFVKLFGGAEKAKAAGVASAVLGMTRGGFGGFMASQAFSAGNVSDKIEKNTKRAADALDDIRGKVGGVPVQ